MEALIKWDNLYKVLEDYGNDVVENYKGLLEQDDHIASRGLIDSVSYTINADGQSISVDINLQDWWKYIEYDTRPHWPPKKALMDWIKVKTTEQLAFLIGRKISIEGTKGDHPLERSLNAVNGHYKALIEEAIEKDINEGLVVILRAFEGI